MTAKVDWTPTDRLSLWSIDAIAAGKRGHVRDIVFESTGSNTNSVTPFAISRDGRHVAVNGALRALADPDTVLWRLPHADEIELAPDDGRALVRDLVALRPPVSLRRADGTTLPLEALCAAWSPRGNRIATANGQALRILDAVTLDEVATMETESLDFGWIDDAYVLCSGNSEPGHRELTRRAPPPRSPGGASLELRRVDGLGLANTLELTGTVRSIRVDERGTRLAVLLEDSVVLVRIER